MRRATVQPVGDAEVGLLAAALVAGVWWGTPLASAAAGVAAAILWRRPDLVVCALVVSLAGVVAGRWAWDEVTPDRLGDFAGWGTLVDDPRPVGRGVRVVVEVEGQRFESFVHGSIRRRLERRQAGDRVLLDARRERLTSAFARRAQARHVVGELTIERVRAHDPGTPLARASNRVRRQLRAGAETVMPPHESALFSGLVIGDDTRQSSVTVGEFRRAGLSHLTAVSGQNVALVLAVAGVGLRRLRTWWRLGATVALIAWFAVVTRLEPSVLRAGCMAILSAVAFATGRDRSLVRLLFVSVMILVTIDPLLVWSVGFWLSVGATFGVVAIAPVLARRLRGPRWWTGALSVTLGAQLGVLVPSWLVFQRMPALGIAANLVAVPVAGLVMLYGLPAALVASLLPGAAATLVMAPAALGTRWVAAVARTAARLEPSGAAAAATWTVQVLALAVVLVRHRRSTGRDGQP